MIGKMIGNWFDKAISASQLETDSRWRKWVKFVDEIDTSKKNGYAFVGDFLGTGTTELELQQTRLLLVASTVGSRKYQTTFYRAVLLHSDGTIEATDIHTNNQKPGWALRIRDKMEALLSAINNETPTSPLAELSDASLLEELRRRGLAT